MTNKIKMKNYYYFKNQKIFSLIFNKKFNKIYSDLIY